jgi:hypothetical protein
MTTTDGNSIVEEGGVKEGEGGEGKKKQDTHFHATFIPPVINLFEQKIIEQADLSYHLICHRDQLRESPARKYFQW